MGQEPEKRGLFGARSAEDSCRRRTITWLARYRDSHEVYRDVQVVARNVFIARKRRESTR